MQKPEASVPAEAYVEIARTMNARSERCYRELVYENEHFETYFRTATPIDVLERMRIGSRPSSRRAQQGIEDLRAIPWVFSWMQNRHALTGWYGVGSALQAAIDEHGEELVREAAREWPFLDALLAEVELAMAQADMRIAACYAELDNSEAGQAIFTQIRDEYELTHRLVLGLRGNDDLLEARPIIARTTSLRNPYIDPMSLLQVRLLKAWRQGGREDDELLAELMKTVNGISQGLQNTG